MKMKLNGHIMATVYSSSDRSVLQDNVSQSAHNLKIVPGTRQLLYYTLLTSFSDHNQIYVIFRKSWNETLTSKSWKWGTVRAASVTSASLNLCLEGFRLFSRGKGSCTGHQQGVTTEVDTESTWIDADTVEHDAQVATSLNRHLHARTRTTRYTKTHTGH